MKALLAICCLVLALDVFAKTGSSATNIQARTLLHGDINVQVNQLNKPLVLLFSDSLCPFRHLPQCEQKIAIFNDMVSTYADKAQWLQIVKGYYVDEAHVLSYLERFNIKVPTVWDTNNEVFTRYQVFGNPYVVVVNENGKVHYRTEHFGENLHQVIKAL